MSTFEDSRYRWRETYFVVFPAANRPALKTVEKKLAAMNKHYEFSNLSADKAGLVESLTLSSPDDFAALDICYSGGSEVLEQGEDLVRELAGGSDPPPKPVLDRIRQCDGRFDVLHFEQVVGMTGEDEDTDELLDPSALLIVLETLAKMTGGIAVDPQSGTILSDT
jgi:hypothetical protein